jgi:NADH-quinone oxidoreductase subunit L
MVVGVVLAWLFVGRREVPLTAPARVSPVTRAARNALYADTVNESLFMRPGQWLTRALVFFDNRGVDGAVNGMAAALGGSSSRLGRVADRLRAHLRPRHARRCRDRGRGAAGGDGG